MFNAKRFVTRIAAVLLLAGGFFSASGALARDRLVIEVAGENAGIIEIELFNDLAPLHVERISMLAASGAYNGIAFHRVIDGFMAQTGDVQFGKVEGYDVSGAGRGGSDEPDLPAEFSKVPYVAGVVGMARSASPNSANSQFFIMFADAPSLNGAYTVIGEVVSGMDVVNAIKRGRGPNGAVMENPDYMAHVAVTSF